MGGFSRGFDHPPHLRDGGFRGGYNERNNDEFFNRGMSPFDMIDRIEREFMGGIGGIGGLGGFGGFN